MKRIFIIISLLLLTGCASVGTVPYSFPDAPASLLEPCPPLETLSSTASLSKLSKVIANNYGKYHTCSAKQNAWQQWYNSQKEIAKQLSK